MNGGTTSARAATFRLVPPLRDLARLRLADRRAVSLDHQPARAAAALGTTAWAVLDPTVPGAVESDRPGLPLATVAAVVDALEDL